jgi:hypothetical protein
VVVLGAAVELGHREEKTEKPWWAGTSHGREALSFGPRRHLLEGGRCIECGSYAHTVRDGADKRGLESTRQVVLCPCNMV